MQDVDGEEALLFSVIIVNFNGGDYLQGAVDSLKRQTYKNFELFVVDNASSDSSMEALDVSGIELVYLLSETENYGFAKANNIAASKANGEWLVLLNPDAVADESWLEKIKNGIEQFPDTRMFASAQYSLDEPSLMDGAGDCYHILGIPWRGGYGHLAAQMPETGECFSPCGAGSIFQKAVYLKAGGFDESYFCYCEDIDLAFRLRSQGEKCVFLHNAMIHHAGSALSNAVGDFALFHGTRNRLWVFIENMPLIPLIVLFLPHLFLTFIIFLKRGCEKEFARGFIAACKGIGPSIVRRKQKQSLRRVSSFTILKSMSWNLVLLLTREPDIKPPT